MTNDHQGLFSNTYFCNMDSSLEETKDWLSEDSGERRHLGADFTQEFIERLPVSRSFILTI